MRFILTLFLCIMLSAQAHAKGEYRHAVSLFELRMNLDQSGEAAALIGVPNLEEIAQSYAGPEEPILPKIDFYAFDAPSHLQGRIDALLNGVTLALPAEYDYFGYDLRRFMASSGNYNIYKNQQNLQQEMLNIKKARIVFQYWRDTLNTKITTIRQGIEENGANAKARSTLKVNVGTLKSFMIETQSWINANAALLSFVEERRRDYQLEGNILKFRTSQAKAEFIALYAAREKSRQQINEYDPFRSVVY